MSTRRKRPASHHPIASPAAGGRIAIDRRDALRALGAASATLVLGPALVGCVTDADPGDESATDVSVDTGHDAGLDGSGGGDVTADAAPDDGAAETGSDDTTGGDAPPGPHPSLRPLRGDGSHPYHYIDNIVVLQMENRSFDHYLGALSLVEGRRDVDGLRADIGNLDALGNNVLIRHLTEEYNIDPDPGHGHNSCLRQFAEGTNGGFVLDWERLLTEANREERLDWVMGYHVRDQLPTMYGLTDAFTVCDRWFCSLLGPTWPNRFYSHAATSEGNWSNRTPLQQAPPYTWLPDGKRFGFYHQSMVHFGITLAGLPRGFPHFDLPKFFEDAAQGTLPNVCFVEPFYGLNDDHPPVDLRLGQAFIHSVYEALRTSPQWDRTLFLVFYDEHGGFHDHVVPPKAAGETRAADGFDQLGFRVPGIVAGGLARRGFTFSEVVDHASVPALISRVFEIDHVNERSRLAGDFAGALDLELTLDAARPAPPALPTIDLSMDKIAQAARRPSGQPELDELAYRRFGIELPTWSDKMRAMERYLRHAEALGTVRVRG